MNTKMTIQSRRGHWVVRTPHGFGQVLAYFQVAGKNGLSRLRPPTYYQLQTWSRDPVQWPRLLQMYEAAYGHAIDVNQMRGRSAWLVDRIDEAFRRERLVLAGDDHALAEASEGSAPSDSDQQRGDGGARSSAPPVAPSDREIKTWFRARLLDEDGEPMAGEDYILVDTDGAKRQGKLDNNGEVYIPPILPPGDCTISFPNIHLNPRKRK